MTILSTTLAAPVALGGALPSIQVVLTAVSVIAGLLWLLSRRRDVRWPPFFVVAAVALGFTLFQLVPLPAGLANWISPRAFEIRADALGVRPSFVPLSLDVPGTWLAVARGLACLIVLVVTASAARRGKGGFFAIPLVFTCAGVVLLAFGQRLAGAETMLGFYKIAHMPGSGFFGTFVSGNHAASLFLLGGLLGLGCARETDGPMRGVLVGCVLLCLAGLFFTSSRFGIVGATAGGFALLTFWLVNHFGPLRGLLAAAGAAVVTTPLMLSLALGQRGQFGLEGTTGALADFKVRGWFDSLQLLVNYPLTGVGRGAFEAPATAYRAQVEGVRLVFPENLLIQMSSEWGIPVSLLLIGLFVYAAWPIARRLPRWEPMFQGAACAVLGVLVHELADFGLEVLGVAMPTAMALGLVSGRRLMSLDAMGAQRSEKPATRQPRPARSAVVLVGSTVGAAVAGAGLVAGAAWAAGRTGDADAGRIRAALAQQHPMTGELINAAISRHPADHDFALLAARWAMRADPPASEALRQLNRAQRLYPAAPAPHVLTAHLLVRLGRPSQAAIELRLANELGADLSYERMERLVGSAQLERTVPRDPTHLFKLASYFVSLGRVSEADAATRKAVTFAESSEAALVRRTQIALSSGNKEFIREAATALARGPSTPEGFELATRGLAAGGELEAARELVRKAAILMPHEGGLTVKGARVLLEHGDLTNARSLLAEDATRNLPFADRIAGEELLAEIADKEGDAAAAAAARARARILVQLRGETTRGAEPGP